MQLYITASDQFRQAYSNEYDETVTYFNKAGIKPILHPDPTRITQSLPSFDEIVDQSINSAPDISASVVVLLAVHEENWKPIIERIKRRNRFVEIVLVSYGGNKSEVSEVLNDGCYAYFEPDFNKNVLEGYVRSAFSRAESRIKRNRAMKRIAAASSSVIEVSKTILEELKFFADYDFATLVLLNRREYFPDGEHDSDQLVRTFVYACNRYGHNDQEPSWRLQRPILHDKVMRRILNDRDARMVYPDVRNDPDIGKDWESTGAPNVHSWIAIPLRYQGKAIGIITLDGHEVNQFSESTVSTLTLVQFAAQAALALQYAQETEASEKLTEALKTVVHEFDLEDALQKITENACALVDGLFGYVVISENGGTNSDLSYKAAWSKHHGQAFKAILEAKVPFDNKRYPGHRRKEGITRRAYIEHSAELHIDDCGSENPDDGNYFSRYDAGGLLDSYIKFAYEYAQGGKSRRLYSRSDIAMAIKARDGRVLGVLNVEHERPYAFTSQHIEALRKFTDFCAIVIERREEAGRVKSLFHSLGVSMQTRPKLEPGNLNVLRGLAEETQRVSRATIVKFFEVIDDRTVLRGWYPESAQENTSNTTRGRDGHTQWVIRNKKRVVIPGTENYINQKEKYLNGDHLIMVNPDTKERGLVCLPIYNIMGGVIGAVWFHFEDAKNFTSDELDDWQLYANIAAIKLENYINEELLGITQRISEKEVNTQDEAREILSDVVEKLRARLDADGIMFYEVESYRLFRRLRRIAVSKDFEADFPNGERMHRFRLGNKGLAWNHFTEGESLRLSGKNGDPDHRLRTISILDYSKYPHAIQKDIEKKKLFSLLSVRLEAPINNEKLGVLIVAGQKDREYSDETKSLIEQFAAQSANILSLIRKNTPLRDPNLLFHSGRIASLSVGAVSVLHYNVLIVSQLWQQYDGIFISQVAVIAFLTLSIMLPFSRIILGDFKLLAQGLYRFRRSFRQ